MGDDTVEAARAEAVSARADAQRWARRVRVLEFRHAAAQHVIAGRYDEAQREIENARWAERR